eukprot:COSAG02_NODE_1023_length_15151_cov_745.123572_2_plen_347_part_00
MSTYTDITHQLRMDFQSNDKDTLVQLLIEGRLELEQSRGQTEFHKLRSQTIQDKYNFQIAYAKEGDKEWKQTTEELEETKQRLAEVEDFWKDCQKYQHFHQKLLKCYGDPATDWDFDELEDAMRKREDIYTRYSDDEFVCSCCGVDVEDPQEENKKLKADYDGAVEVYGKLQEEIERLENTNKKLKAEVEELKEQLEDDTRQVHKLFAENDKLKLEIKNIKVWIDKLFIQNKSEWFVGDLKENGFMRMPLDDNDGSMVYRFNNKDIGKDWTCPKDLYNGELDVMDEETGDIIEDNDPVQEVVVEAEVNTTNAEVERLRERLEQAEESLDNAGYSWDEENEWYSCDN